MSRVGKRPIEIPSGVTVEYNAPEITVKGGKTTLKRTLPPLTKLNIEGQVITVVPLEESKTGRSMWGLTRTLVSNMVEGVSTGFSKELEVVGVGYKVELKGKNLLLNLGYSHQIDFPLPDGISAEVDKQQVKLVLRGADKELLGLTAARIRDLRKPEPYKGKGVKYADEVIRRKVGKAGIKQE
jgi:large subunit ribosomal protein L6